MKDLCAFLAGVVVMATVLLAVGCESGARHLESPALSVTEYRSPPNFYAYEFHLNDGTRCVTVSGGGVTCGWRDEGVEK